MTPTQETKLLSKRGKATRTPSTDFSHCSQAGRPAPPTAAVILPSGVARRSSSCRSASCLPSTVSSSSPAAPYCSRSSPRCSGVKPCCGGRGVGAQCGAPVATGHGVLWWQWPRESESGRCISQSLHSATHLTCADEQRLDTPLLIPLCVDDQLVRDSSRQPRGSWGPPFPSGTMRHTDSHSQHSSFKPPALPVRIAATTPFSNHTQLCSGAGFCHPLTRMHPPHPAWPSSRTARPTPWPPPPCSAPPAAAAPPRAQRPPAGAAACAWWSGR